MGKASQSAEPLWSAAPCLGLCASFVTRTRFNAAASEKEMDDLSVCWMLQPSRCAVHVCEAFGRCGRCKAPAGASVYQARAEGGCRSAVDGLGRLSVQTQRPTVSRSKSSSRLASAAAAAWLQRLQRGWLLGPDSLALVGLYGGIALQLGAQMEHRAPSCLQSGSANCGSACCRARRQFVPG